MLEVLFGDAKFNCYINIPTLHLFIFTKDNFNYRNRQSERTTQSIIMSLHIEQERSPRAYLCNPVDDIPVGERNIRVEDWLNDKVQTTADMTDLSSLLENVEAKQRQLEEQVSRSVHVSLITLANKDFS